MKVWLRSLFFSLLLVTTLGLSTPAATHAQLCDPVGGTPGTGVDTAIGCLATGEPYVLIGQLLGWGTIVGGGVAFLMVIFAGLQIATASGDPKRIKAAQELMTSAIAGLMLIIFSIVLLNLIGIKVLNLGTLGFLTP